MIEITVYAATKSQMLLYNLLSFSVLLYLLYRYRKMKLFWFVIFLFFNGTFFIFGKSIQNIYRIVLMLSFSYALVKYQLLNYSTSFFKNSFYLFSLVFILTSFYAGDYFTIIFSQYSRYFIVFVSFLFLYAYRYESTLNNHLPKLLYYLLFIQIIFSVIKFIIFGRPTESLVGTIVGKGGAAATSLPIIGFMVLWVKQHSQLKWKDWLFIIGLLFIGFMSEKRAIWFISPIIIGAFMFYVSGRKINLAPMIIGVIATPLVFYLGLRLNPTLNPENKIWGSFDIDYAYKYADIYMFGTEENIDKKENIEGRGGATLSLLDKISESSNLGEIWLGNGLAVMYATDYEEFKNKGFGLNHKGSATGIFQTFVTNGFLGILTLILWVFSLVSYTANRRVFIVIALFLAWEYIFYTGIVLREPALSFLIIYIVLFSPNQIVSPEKNIQ